MEAQPETLVRHFYATENTKIMTLSGKNESAYFLDLFSNDGYKREGENSLSIRDETMGFSLLTFCFIHYNNKLSLFIGGLQGPKFKKDDELGKSKITEATKNLFGLFPKKVLLQAICAIAEHFKVEQIIAVSNQTHFYNNWRYNRTIHASYDDFWEMNGGERDARNNYILPIYPPQKPLEEIASKKRSEYRKRYELMANLNSALKEKLNEWSNKTH